MTAITIDKQPYEVAMRYLDVPFRHRGRTRNGLDCVGLLIMVARDLGYGVTDKRVYGRNPIQDGLREYLVLNGCKPVAHPRDGRRLRPNDVVLIKFDHSDIPTHVGLIAPHPYGVGIIHSYGDIGRVTYHRLDDRRRRQIVEVFEWPEKS